MPFLTGYLSRYHTIFFCFLFHKILHIFAVIFKQIYTQLSYNEEAKKWKFQVTLHNIIIQLFLTHVTFSTFLTIWITDALSYLKCVPLDTFSHKH